MTAPVMASINSHAPLSPPLARSIGGHGPTSRPAVGSGLDIDMDINDSSSIVRLRGELDSSTGDMLSDTVTWLRRRHSQRPVVIDTSRLSFVDVAGRRALLRALCRPDGSRDPRVLHVVGAAVARLELLIALAARPR